MKTIALLPLLLAAFHVQAQDIFVSPSGNDKNPGSIEKPLATLAKAKETVKKINKSNIPITVNLRQGVYYLQEPLKLSKEDGGTQNAPVVYAAFKGEQVTLCGSKAMPAAAFKKITDKETLARVAPQLRDSIVVLDLATAKMEHIKKYQDKFDDDGGMIELFMDEKRMPLSRYPNEGFMAMKKVLVNGGGQETKTANWADYYGEKPPPTVPRPGVFEYRDMHENQWASLLDRGVWIKGFWRIPWQNEAVRIDKMDTIAHTITLAAPISGGIGNKYTRPGGNGKEPYWLLNLLEEIDRPGEWAVDFKDKKLYFYPPEKIKDGNVRIADIGEPLIQIDNAAYIQLKGILLEENLGDGIKISDGNNNLIAGCTVRNVTKNGVVLDGGTAHTVLSNDIYNTGAGGIWLRGGDENSIPKTSCGFKVINNHIHHYSQLTRIYAAGINAGFTGGGGGGHHVAVGMYIAHNVIHDAPHVGVLYGSWNNVFEYNEVFNYCTVSDDMGAFYCYDQTARMGGHTLAYNFVHNSTLGDGIYFDDDHNDIHVYGNLVALYNDPKRRGTAFLYKSGTQAKKNTPIGIECYNNIAVNCNYGFQFVTLPTMVDSNKIYNNISVLNNVPFRNRILEPSNKEHDTAYIPSPTGKQNITYKEDPGFVDLKNFIFKLRADSKVFKDLPGFVPLPIDKMGLFIDQYRKKLPTDAEIKRFDALPKKENKNGTEILDRG
ncbi:right-handed parallel beta-helix repeat-containing protein [Parasediminibacterium sp. JCM 36343]|uniref:right-handed parallel beta-helix repeat-containing protein n=1 Tax=Parasediminibacterium sp. JCM 36343 TaxID=3374279 RepID=UPI0039797E6B